MVDGRRIIGLIFFFTHAKFWRNSRIVKRSVFKAAVIKTTGNTYSANSI